MVMSLYSLEGEEELGVNEWAHCAHLLREDQTRQLVNHIEELQLQQEEQREHEDVKQMGQFEGVNRNIIHNVLEGRRANNVETTMLLQEHTLRSNIRALWAMSGSMRHQQSLLNPFRKKSFAWKVICPVQRSVSCEKPRLQEVVRRYVKETPLLDVNPRECHFSCPERLLDCISDVHQAVDDCRRKIRTLGKFVSANAESIFSNASPWENTICAFCMKCGGSQVDKRMLYAALLLLQVDKTTAEYSGTCKRKLDVCGIGSRQKALKLCPKNNPLTSPVQEHKEVIDLT